MPLQSCPIHFNTVPQMIRRDGKAVGDLEMVGHVFVESESVVFEIGCVWYGGQQVHVQVVDSMRRDGQTDLLREPGDSEPRGDSADVRDVRLGKGDAAG